MLFKTCRCRGGVKTPTPRYNPTVLEGRLSRMYALRRPSIGIVIAPTSWNVTGPTVDHCRDSSGRGATVATSLDISCTPVGSDLQCSGVATNKHEMYVYCEI